MPRVCFRFESKALKGRGVFCRILECGTPRCYYQLLYYTVLLLIALLYQYMYLYETFELRRITYFLASWLMSVVLPGASFDSSRILTAAE